jgi:hypothetical protein
MSDPFAEAAQAYWSYKKMADSPNRADRVAAEEHDWALELVTDIGDADQGPPLDVLDALIGTAPNEEALAHVGAGPLETLLVGYGVQYGSEVETRCRRDSRWLRALKSVWWDGIDEGVGNRLKRLVT